MRSTAWTPDAVQAFAPVCSNDPFGPLLTPAEMLHGSYLYDYQRGNQSALVALTREVFAGGIRVHVQGLVSDAPGQLQTRHLMQDIEATARNLGADVLTLCTRHPAIAASAPRWGGRVSGAIITKFLRLQ
jgi:hypothetical protein